MEVEATEFKKLAQMMLMGNLRLAPDTSCCDYEEVHEDLSWRERLLSLRPWKKVRVRHLSHPSKRILMIDNVLICHPEVAAKIQAALDGLVKAPVPQEPHIIATDGGARHAQDPE